MKPRVLPTLLRAALAAFALVSVARGSVVQGNFNALTRSGTSLVGITSAGDIKRSTDSGATFTTVRASSSPALNNLNSSGATVIAVGDSGLIARSADSGAAWSDLTIASAPAIGPLKDVASSNGTFWVTVGQNNAGKLAAEWSNDGGANWSAATSIPNVSGTLKAIIYDAGASRWCAVGTDGIFNGTTLTEGAIILTSADGKTWTSVTPPSGATALNDIASDGAGNLLAVGDAGSLLISSNGGQAFAVQSGSGAVSENLTSVVYSSTGGGFTAGGQDLVQITYTVAGGSTVSQAPVPGGGDISTLIVDGSGQVVVSGTDINLTATVTLGNLAATYDGTAKSATATTSPAGLTVAFTYDGSSTAPTNAGSYAVVGTITGSSYTGSANGTLVIAKASQTISFTGPADQGFTSSPIALSATATSNLAVSFSVVSGPATVNGSSLTLTGAGTVVVQASQAGNSNYNAATSINQTFVVAANFESWRLANFTAPELADTNVSGPSAVYGADGLSNLVKYALGLAPKTDTVAGLPQVTVANGEWVFTYTRPSAITDVTYAVETSTNLSTWSTTGVTHELVSSTGGVATWRARYPVSSASTAFFRLVVTR